MKNITIILFLLVVGLNGFGQVNDSTIYNKYVKMKSVDSVFYQKLYHNNGQLKKEGWVIYETVRNDNNLKNIVIPKDTVIELEHNVGVIKYYNKDAHLKAICELSNDLKAEGKETFYNSNGEVDRIIISKEKDTIYYSAHIKNNKKDKISNNIKGLEYLRISYYNKGTVFLECNYIGNMIKHGCWKWFNTKDNSIRKERFYENGKKIRNSCY